MFSFISLLTQPTNIQQNLKSVFSSWEKARQEATRNYVKSNQQNVCVCVSANSNSSDKSKTIKAQINTMIKNLLVIIIMIIMITSVERHTRSIEGVNQAA